MDLIAVVLAAIAALWMLFILVTSTLASRKKKQRLEEAYQAAKVGGGQAVDELCVKWGLSQLDRTEVLVEVLQRLVKENPNLGKQDELSVDFLGRL